MALKLTVILTAITMVTAEPKNSTWYTRYAAYPSYCSTPVQMANRSIPPLAPNTDAGDSRLVHVTAVIRHGARTPYSSGLKCWDGFWTDHDTAKWDCDLTTFVAPPDPYSVQHEEGWTPAGSDAMFLFSKKYDALLFPQDNLRNELNGTCQSGQLLFQGYEQSLKNGEYLRAAYVYDGTKLDHDITMRLLDLAETDSPPYKEPTLYFRSDDDQRTIMSGQILLRGLFGTEFAQHAQSNGAYPVIPLHIADRNRDILAPAENLCPKLTDLSNEAMSSTAWQRLEHSEEATTMRQFMKEELGDVMVGAIDCLMTTMCTDRALPEVLDDFQGNHRQRRMHNGEGHDEEHHSKWGDNLFQRILDYATQSAMFPIMFSDAAYAKLAMGPMWAEIMENILPIISPENSHDRGMPRNRLALFSGHDSTILPLLATLGPNVWDGIEWTPYASMLLLEIHEFIDGQTDKNVYTSDYSFRLIYNGKVLTDTIEGCQKEHDLCDISVLLNQTIPIAKRDRDCTAAPKNSDLVAVEQSEKLLLSSSGGLALVFIIIIISAAAGGVGMHYHLTRRMPWVSAPIIYDEIGVNDLQLTATYQDHPTAVELRDCNLTI